MFVRERLFIFVFAGHGLSLFVRGAWLDSSEQNRYEENAEVKTVKWNQKKLPGRLWISEGQSSVATAEFCSMKCACQLP